MATVNFSVPDEVKTAFDAAFAGRNKSAVIAELMRRAVDEQARQARRLRLFRILTAGRAVRGRTTSAEIHRIRRSGRP
jgi:hypothetical protein